ncbi:MAG TPA: metallophosphoesterase [Blastocatellia bacterium]|jgi:predicted MPP superfamily phosphohydrolase|nr:metallophosphoesterase [Blastocatellia bacterium]
MIQLANKLLRSRVKIILLALLCLLAFLALWAFVIEPSRLVLRETRITLPSWPANFKGLRIAVISDLHAGSPFITLDKIYRIVETTNAAQPDLILLPGDFVIQGVPGGSFMEPEVIASALKGLRARFGVFATLGNHDWWYNGQRVKRSLENAGITALENDAAMIERNGASIWVAGIGDKWEGNPDIASALARVPASAQIIALTHNPDIFPSIPARVALTIAGHTHGGQVALPIIGRPIVPSDFGERYAAGHIVEGPKHLFVTTGVGTSILPVRFRVPPEISLLTID